MADLEKMFGKAKMIDETSVEFVRENIQSVIDEFKFTHGPSEFHAKFKQSLGNFTGRVTGIPDAAVVSRESFDALVRANRETLMNQWIAQFEVSSLPLWNEMEDLVQKVSDAFGEWFEKVGRAHFGESYVLPAKNSKRT